MNVLVTDGEHRSALAVTRSLGRKGCDVFVAGKQGNISASSMYCCKSFSTPDPLQDCSGYVHAIMEIVAKERIDVIFPMTEQSIYCLNKGRDQLGMGVILACAPPEMMEAVSNKFKLFLLAERVGVAVPLTTYVLDFKDFLEKRRLVTKFPVVVKPAFSKTDSGEGIISSGVMYASSEMELELLYETKPVLKFPSLIQELIVGEGTGLFTLFDSDHPLALFSHRRVLEKPPTGGVSVLSESIPLDDEMVQASLKLLSEVGWRGVAMVEFKRDIRDGRVKLMEINGRFWGSLQLAVSSGVDFPGLYLDYHLGIEPSVLLSDYRVGLKLRWFYGVIDHFLIRIKQSKYASDVSSGLPSLLYVPRELLRPCGVQVSSDVYDKSDKKPFLVESLEYVRNVYRNRI